MNKTGYQENCFNCYQIQKKNENKRSFGTDITGHMGRIAQKTSSSPLLLQEYATDIYKIMHNAEEKNRPSSKYMSSQNAITESHRGKLINWLLTVHYKFELVEETLFLTVNLIDRYLERILVGKEELQLIGISCMFVACKYEEVSCPEISDFVYVTDDVCTAEDIIKTEKEILKVLGFEVSVPSTLRFYERYSMICRFDEYAFNVGLYLIELALLDYTMLKYRPSTIAGAAVFLAKKIMKNQVNKKSAKKNSEESLSSCAMDLADLVDNSETSKFASIKLKFADCKFQQVSKAFLTR